MGTAKARWKWKYNKARDVHARTDKSGKRQRTGYVYIFYLGIEDLYKIGFSVNYKQRLKSFQAANPLMRVVSLFRMIDARTAEKKVHHMLNKMKVEREVFRLTPNQLRAATDYLTKRQGHTNGEIAEQDTDAEPEELAPVSRQGAYINI